MYKKQFPIIRLGLTSTILLYVLFLWGPLAYAANPVPDIKVNGSDGPVTVSPTDPVQISVELGTGSMAGVNCDWWVLRSTPSGWYHYNVGASWTPGLVTTYQGGIFDLPSYQVMNMVLPEGAYTFYFGVDTVPNGSPDMGSIFYDNVDVTVSAGKANTTPIANAGPDRDVKTGQVFTLNGIGSSDADGDSLTYSWSIVSKPKESKAEFTYTTVVAPIFTTDLDGAYVIAITVNDGKVDSLPYVITVISSGAGPWATASAGPYYTAAIKTDGTLWTWGNNNRGQLGNGDLKGGGISPIQIGRSANWASVSTGKGYTVAIRKDGTLWSWGETIDRYTPREIGAAADWASSATSYYGAYDYIVLLTKTDGTLWGWGNNEKGQFGDGTTEDKPTPTRIGTEQNWAAVVVGWETTFAIKTDGTLWGWGSNRNGMLGDGAKAAQTTPIQIGTDGDWEAVSPGSVHIIGKKADGTLWAWGKNSYGQVGDGTIEDRKSPIQIGTDTDWASVSANYRHNVAIKTDGTLWAWGKNDSGQVGDGTTENRASPIQIGTDTDWASVSAGENHTVAIKSDGTLWAWGGNGSGQFGDGTKIDKSVPTKTSFVDTNSPGIPLNSAPVANAGPDQNVFSRSSMTLDGSGSNDADGDGLTYSWVLTTSPLGSGAVLTSATTATPSFTADLDGAYFFRLLVSDGLLYSFPDEITVFVSSPSATSMLKLLASDSEIKDGYGSSVSVSGNTAIIGAKSDKDNGNYSGSAYVFVRDSEAGAWRAGQKLLASDGVQFDHFGSAVSISGDIAIISATGGGSAYIFRRNNSTGSWHEESKLTASDRESDNGFGNSVSVSNDTVVIGAYYDGDMGTSSGAAYVFVRDRLTGTWREKSKLTAVDGDSRANFGYSVSIDGDTAIIGAYHDYDKALKSGSAYIFVRDSTTGFWREHSKLAPAEGSSGDYFGCAVSIRYDKAIVGAFLFGDDVRMGAAYVYERDGQTGHWREHSRLTASDGRDLDRFGDSVSISGNRAVIGARLDDDYGEDSGSAYVFVRNMATGTWDEQSKLFTPDGGADDEFGNTLSVNGNTAVIGSDRGGGSAYIFQNIVP